jgi:molybdopterin molybdotransferase
VAILATGDEVVAPGVVPAPGQIWDSNSDAIAAMVLQAGGVPVRLGIARDSEAEIRTRLSAESGVDLFVTTGGVSAGDFDLIKEILRQDARIEFWQINIKPGRPLAFGSFGGAPLLGLPGNPVAAAVTFLQFVRPAILRMLGRTDLDLPRIDARMLDPVENRGGRRHYLRVTLTKTETGYDARLAGAQGAAVLSSLAQADGLLVVPETMEFVEPGAMLPVELLD